MKFSIRGGNAASPDRVWFETFEEAYSFWANLERPLNRPSADRVEIWLNDYRWTVDMTSATYHAGEIL